VRSHTTEVCRIRLIRGTSLLIDQLQSRHWTGSAAAIVVVVAGAGLRLRLVWVLWPQRGARSGSRGRLARGLVERASLQQLFILHFGGHHESLIHHLPGYGRSLQEVQTLLGREGRSFFIRDLPLICSISLVPNQCDGQIFIRRTLCLFQPASGVVEGGPVRDVVDQQRPLCPSVVASNDGPKSVLTRSVPTLELDSSVVVVEDPGSKLHTHCDFVGQPVPLVRELQQQASFTHCLIPDDDELEEVVVFLADACARGANVACTHVQ